MWILPQQLHTSAYVQDTKALDVDLETFGQMSERSLMWRSKPSQSQTWLRRWKRVNYIQHLSIRTLKLSHSRSFLKRWIYFQRASLVSRLVLPEDENQQTIRDIYTHISLKESRPVSQLTLFSKMSKGLSVPKRPLESLYSSMSAEIWKKEVIKQRGEYSQRLKLGRLINEKGSSSWPTPDTTNANDGVPWEKSKKQMEERRKKVKELVKQGKIKQGSGRSLNLATAVQKEKDWPTPTGAEVSGGTRTKQILEGKWGNVQLREAIELEQVKNWGTPKEQDSRAASWDRGKSNLGEQVHGQDTPHGQAKSNTSGKSQESWGTPALYDYNKRPRAEVNSKQASMARNLGRLKQDGKLNPNWVEQMMGLEVGWTQLPTEWID